MEIADEKKFESDRRRVEKIRHGDKSSLEELFFEYYQDLCAFAFKMIKSSEQAEDIVQEVFYNVWKQRKEWHIRISLRAYLFQAVRNHALNVISRNKRYRHVREAYARELEWHNTKKPHGLNQEDRQLVDHIWAVVQEMPSRRQAVFVLHQKHGLSYREIAEVLNVQRKTVENHMGYALSEIRKRIGMTRLESHYPKTGI